MNKEKEKQIKYARRKRKIRSKVFGSPERPRLNVYKSNKELFLQIINDQKGETLLSLYSKNFSNKPKNRKELAFEMGKQIAKMAVEKKILKVVFDRGGYPYHGIIKRAAEGAREGGLKF